MRDLSKNDVAWSTWDEQGISAFCLASSLKSSCDRVFLIFLEKVWAGLGIGEPSISLSLEHFLVVGAVESTTWAYSVVIFWTVVFFLCDLCLKISWIFWVISLRFSTFFEIFLHFFWFLLLLILFYDFWDVSSDSNIKWSTSTLGWTTTTSVWHLWSFWGVSLSWSMPESPKR